MNSLLCGLDAGGTSTRALVACADGSISGAGFCSGANPNHAGWSGADAAMRGAVEHACQAAEMAPGEIRSIFLGIAGVISSDDRRRATEICRGWKLASGCNVAVDHDIRIALEGGLSGRPGIALIAGTGSSCYGRNTEGETWQAGGWDRLLDDLGSGYDLAQKAMAAACRSADGRSEKSLLESVLFDALGVTNVTDFTVKVHRPGMARHEIAALAPLVVLASQQGDAIATRILRTAADELAQMVEAVSTRLFPTGNPEVVFIGGMLEKHEVYRHAVEQAIRARIPFGQITASELRPAAGALALAAKQSGRTLSSSLLKRLSSEEKKHI